MKSANHGFIFFYLDFFFFKANLYIVNGGKLKLFFSLDVSRYLPPPPEPFLPPLCLSHCLHFFSSQLLSGVDGDCKQAIQSKMHASAVIFALFLEGLLTLLANKFRQICPPPHHHPFHPEDLVIFGDVSRIILCSASYSFWMLSTYLETWTIMWYL